MPSTGQSVRVDWPIELVTIVAAIAADHRELSASQGQLDEQSMLSPEVYIWSISYKTPALSAQSVVMSSYIVSIFGSKINIIEIGILLIMTQAIPMHMNINIIDIPMNPYYTFTQSLYQSLPKTLNTRSLSWLLHTQPKLWLEEWSHTLSWSLRYINHSLTLWRNHFCLLWLQRRTQVQLLTIREAIKRDE